LRIESWIASLIASVIAIIIIIIVIVIVIVTSNVSLFFLIFNGIVKYYINVEKNMHWFFNTFILIFLLILIRLSLNLTEIITIGLAVFSFSRNCKIGKVVVGSQAGTYCSKYSRWFKIQDDELNFEFKCSMFLYLWKHNNNNSNSNNNNSFGLEWDLHVIRHFGSRSWSCRKRRRWIAELYCKEIVKMEMKIENGII